MNYDIPWFHENCWENKQPSYKKYMSVLMENTDCTCRGLPRYIRKAFEGEELINEDNGKSHYTKLIYHLKDKDLTQIHRRDDGINTTWTIKHLLDDVSDIDRYLAIPYEPPEIDMSDFYKTQERMGDNGLMVLNIADPICLGASLFEMGNFLTLAMTETNKIKYFLDALHERQMRELKILLGNEVKDVIVVVNGPEYATPPYLSPDFFYEFVTCYLIEICREIKSAGAIPLIHCHGKIGRIIDQFAMTEGEMLDPIEPPPDGDIELADVKKRYGNKFCLVGNIELKEIDTADRDRIDYLVKKAMEDAKEGSGFMLMPTATPLNEPIDKKTEENYIQMVESGIKYGKY
jgi:hypothetical protein